MNNYNDPFEIQIAINETKSFSEKLDHYHKLWISQLDTILDSCNSRIKDLENKQEKMLDELQQHQYDFDCSPSIDHPLSCYAEKHGE